MEQQTNGIDLNNRDYEQDPKAGLIPAGTHCRVQVELKEGGSSDSTLNCHEPILQVSQSSDAAWLEARLQVIGGQYNGRYIWTMLGMRGAKADSQWAQMGARLIRQIVEAHRGISHKDYSPEASKKRDIQRFTELNGMQCDIIVGVKTEEYQGEDHSKNTLKKVLPFNPAAQVAAAPVQQVVQQGQPVPVQQAVQQSPAPATPVDDIPF